MSRTIQAVDLFAGAGGTSTGLALACKELGRKVNLTAINHWPEAVETHTANHPWANHICQDVRTVNPEEVIPGGRCHILVASPECIYYSRAAGGRPKLDQYRATAWDILPWLERIRVSNLLIENVPEFRDWGPVNGDGHPIKRLKGTIYQAWLRAIRAHGYNVDTRILNAADYGAATSRARFFLIAKKGNAPIVWPTSTKSKKGLGKKKWRGAKEIIDWSLKGESIFTRKRPLSDTTMRRIIAGLKRFGGHELQPFLVLMEHGGGIRSVDEPLPTITTAKGGSMVIADQAFILSQASGGAPRSVDDPMPTITGGGGDAIVQPFILPVRGFFGQNTPKSINDPLGTITQRGGGDLIQPFIIPYFGERDGQKPRTHAVEEPLPAVTSHGAGALIDACLVKYYGNGGPQSVDDPLGTLTTKDRYGLAEPYLVRFNGTENAASEDSRRAWKNSAKSTAEPLPTVTGGQRFGLAEPYLVRFNGTDQAHITDSSRSIDDPLPTVVGSNSHFALIQPEASGCYLDIRFRMLQPHELSAAMGFPAGYAFVGNKTEVIKQIGNAVVVQVAQALVMSLLTTTSKKGRLV